MVDADTSETQINFIRQQGFRDASARTCDVQYASLMFQPRVIAVLVLAGVLFQAPGLFLALSGVLWWNALAPTLNPFDWLHNTLVAGRQGVPPLTAAPRPRRFAQGLAATLMALIGIALLEGWYGIAVTIEALLLVALGLLVFGSFCIGSYLFHLVTGNGEFARRTLPWKRRA
jgi:hypothetical protein